jgi:ABC-type transporter MlaC component
MDTESMLKFLGEIGYKYSCEFRSSISQFYQKAILQFDNENMSYIVSGKHCSYFSVFSNLC